MITITRKLEFDAGHRIPDHKSQCRNLHGHRYTIEITLVGEVIDARMRVRMLAVTSAKRASSLPDVPSLAESGLAGYEVLNWFGMAAPARTPPAVIAKLNAATVKSRQHTSLPQNRDSACTKHHAIHRPVSGVGHRSADPRRTTEPQFVRGGRRRAGSACRQQTGRGAHRG